MRIVTWNVNSLRARLPRVLEFLAEFAPDIACLQETKVAPDTFPTDELDEAGYQAVHHSAGQWAGVALLAKHGHTIEDPARGLSGEPVSSEARWVEATIAGIRCASTYVPNGRTLDSPEFPRKLEFLEAVRHRAAALRASAVRAGTPGSLLIAGDINIAPEDRDVYDPSAFIGGTHVSDDERKRLNDILATGLTDAYRHVHPDEVQYTWWDYRAGHFHKGFGLRIDLAMVSPDLADRLTECGMVRNYRKGQKPSDHAPLLLELTDQPS